MTPERRALRHCLPGALIMSALLPAPFFTRSAIAQTPDLQLNQEWQEAQPPVEHPPAPPLPGEGHLFEGWAGLLPWLDQRGVTLDADYFFEAAGNVSGGRSQGAGYADQRAFKIDAALDKMLGAPAGLGVHIALLNRGGSDVSYNAIGDRLFSVTEIYGGGGNVAVHLAYAYIDELIDEGRLRIAAGRLQAGTAFFASPIYCEFATLALCAEPRPIPGGNSAFTNGGANNFGGFVRGRPTINTYVALGAFEANPNRGGRSGFDWSTSQSTGAMFPVELAWEPGPNAGELLGHYKVGMYYDTSAHDDLHTDVNGSPIALSGLPAKRDQGQFGFWIAADQMVLRHGPGDNQGLVVFAAYAHTNGDVSIYQDQAFIGIDDHGLLASRPQDSFGVTFIYAHQSDALKKTQEIQTALGEPLAGGAVGIETHEMIFEAQYSAHLYRGVDLGPDFQYIVRPGASDRYDNAVVLGAQGNVKF